MPQKGKLSISRLDGVIVTEWRAEDEESDKTEVTRLGKSGKVRRIGPEGRTLVIEGEDKQRVIVWLQSASTIAKEACAMV